MKKYYATGNGGSGTAIYAFSSKKQRDEFVAWNEGYDQRRAVTLADARKYGRTAMILGDAENPSVEINLYR